MNVPSRSAARNNCSETALEQLARPAGTRSSFEPILGAHRRRPFTRAELDHLRAHVTRCVPPLVPGDLLAFLRSIIQDDEIVSACFRPQHALVTVRGREAMLVVPFDRALEAASRAASMPALLQQERPIAWVGALSYSIVHFYITAAATAGHALPQPPESRLDVLREVLLRDALRGLRVRDYAIVRTLAAALGVGATDDCDVQQVARL